MYDGFVKVAAGTPRIRVADCRHNAEKTFELMREAGKAGVRILVLPEMGLTGYTCGDLFFQRTLLKGAEEGLQTILKATRSLDLLTVVGMPLVYHNKLYNCAVVIQSGAVLGVVPKTYLPNYGEFYEKRNFVGGFEGNDVITLNGREVPFGSRLLFRCAEMPELTMGVELCEDLWTPRPPSIGYAEAGATLIANLSASDEIVGKDSYRRALVVGQSARLVCGYIYAGAGEGESTTDMVFGAHNMIAENGVLLGESRFKTGLTVSEVDLFRLVGERCRMDTFPPADDSEYLTVPFHLPLEKTALTRYVSSRPFVPEDREDRKTRCEEILLLASLGLKKRLEHTGAKTAVVGLSGGLDSTLALLITTLSMNMLDRPASDIVAVTMPCFGTTDRTRSNAVELAGRLGATLRKIDISATVRSHFADIGQDMENQDVTFENGQARERTQVLMDIANQTGGIVIGTGDLSELALGWATYNGDHMSMYGVNASIPKTLVRHLVDYVSRDNEEKASELSSVLTDILATPVSPELLPGNNGDIVQRTEDLVGPYELHDFFLYYAVRWAFPPAKVFRLAEYAFGKEYSRTVILKWLKVFYRRFFSQQFKRSCLPDGPKVGSVTLSPRGDWRMPSDACAELWLAEAEQL
ncbi:NAD(+) synthase [Papillibacter cinnamivorans]|uniref:Glutamine-dependent NAD(+) synthetase n=1 Tax=Papillibacter cinnamivorans DSM 12816 TaxID=1122930 RepID=A0A1W2AAJ1_9FIRM|nr:NAD(+) synthase [Papillibacter cinnamivorans]SMC57654.1 NAD+ synthase (glutamine-hydrolysing) [Papillibacter cinnamivorans DSM 12816]